jgi:hypothetical protein
MGEIIFDIVSSVVEAFVDLFIEKVVVRFKRKR